MLVLRLLRRCRLEGIDDHDHREYDQGHVAEKHFIRDAQPGEEFFGDERLQHFWRDGAGDFAEDFKFHKVKINKQS
jgi:hypothetical protein